MAARASSRGSGPSPSKNLEMAIYARVSKLSRRSWGSTDLVIPLRPTQQRNSLRWFLTGDTCVCLQSCPLAGGELIDVDVRSGHGG